jgi:hypothetical protein
VAHESNRSTRQALKNDQDFIQVPTASNFEEKVIGRSTAHAGRRRSHFQSLLAC